MARDQANPNIRNNRRQASLSKDQGKRPRALRKSLRLQAKRQSHKQSLSKSNHIQEVQAPLSPPISNIPEGRTQPQILHKPPTSSRKRKREQEEQEAELDSSRIREQPPSKRPQIPPPSCTAAVGLEKKEKERKKKSASDIIQVADPFEYWTLTKRWPKEYFEQHSQAREGFEKDSLEQDSWLEEQMENPQVIKYVEINGFKYPCPIRKVPISLSRRQSDSSLNDSSDQKNREKKSAPYKTARYTTLLEAKGSYMKESKLGVSSASLSRCTTLLDSEQTVPKDSLFRDDLFRATCDKIQDRNEARVVRSITPYIVPSAEDLETLGATHLEHLIEGVNECWTGNVAVEGPLPRPDYSVGFRRSAFTVEQLKKLDPLIGSVFENSLFVATYRMYFPFLTCEVKCGAAALDVADRQNAHSMTVAVRALIELFRLVKREKELNQEILAFSVSHDHRSVRIYGHYPMIEEDKTTFYRHPIHEFSFTALDGKEKWTAYKFTKNLYDIWMPILHGMICSAINDVPADISFDLSQSASFFESTPQSSQLSNADATLGFLASQEVTPTTSFTQVTEPAFKKPRNKRSGGQQR